MEKGLESLERKREALYRRISGLGDMRRGMISLNYRKCGKKNCVCAQKGHPGHGPQYLWNTTIKRKSYAKNLKIGPELEKYMKEIANHQEFIKLCREVVEINEQICELRPVPDISDMKELEELKKKLERQFEKKYKKK
ncbi:MAG: hypothetical protein HY786_03770 [Deltaproteobacteria bacterium]|nr:hypothetical protein [Deltaproteobacteria bacterium]